MGARRSQRGREPVPGKSTVDPGSLAVRQANFEAQQAALTQLGADDTLRLYATWCADAESDFRNIVHPGDVGSSQGVHHSEGIYGQTLPWWPNDHFDIAAATAAFVTAARPVIEHSSGDIVRDLWDVQHWSAPDWRISPDGFWSAPETQNYARREDSVRVLLRTGTLTE